MFFEYRTAECRLQNSKLLSEFDIPIPVFDILEAALLPTTDANSMTRRSLLVLLFMLGWAACSNEPAPPDRSAAPAAEAPAPGDPVLQLDKDGRTVSVTHRPTGRTHLLFEDEVIEDSEEGTFHQVLSRFGPYVSYSMEWYYEGGAHPSYGATYNAVVVGETVEEADLRHLFSEEAIYAALQQIDFVQQAEFSHSTLTELLDGLAAAYECEMSFDDFFSSFFVEAVRGDTAVVIVGLTHGCEVQRGNFTTLTLRMNTAEDKKALFDDHQAF